MKTLVVIPARLGATRLPRKPLRPLAGAPLIVRVWERIAALQVAQQVVVATDSDEVADAVRAAGADVALTSPDHPSGTDRVAEVAARPAFRGFDVILNVQGDEPFVDADAVRGALEQVTSGRFPLGTAAAPASAAARMDPNVVKVVAADDGRAMYFSRAPIPFLRDAVDAPRLDGQVWQHVGIYAYEPAALRHWVGLPVHPLEQVEKLEQLRPLAAGLPMGVAFSGAPARPGIDTEEDLARAEAGWHAFTTDRS